LKYSTNKLFKDADIDVEFVQDNESKSQRGGRGIALLNNWREAGARSRG